MIPYSVVKYPPWWMADFWKTNDGSTTAPYVGFFIP
jgi:hypothetical protein